MRASAQATAVVEDIGIASSQRVDLSTRGRKRTNQVHMNMAETAARYWNRLNVGVRVPRDLTALTLLTISTPRGNIPPHASPHKTGRDETRRSSGARVGDGVDGGEQEAAAAGRHQRSDGPCAGVTEEAMAADLKRADLQRRMR
jgi:hypothetical protein